MNMNGHNQCPGEYYTDELGVGSERHLKKSTKVATAALVLAVANQIIDAKTGTNPALFLIDTLAWRNDGV